MSRLQRLRNGRNRFVRRMNGPGDKDKPPNLNEVNFDELSDTSEEFLEEESSDEAKVKVDADTSDDKKTLAERLKEANAKKTQQTSSASNFDGQPSGDKRKPGIPTPTLEDEKGNFIIPTALDTVIEFKYRYFPERITERGGQRQRLYPYFPYVELRKRTTPLPSVSEYISAMYDFYGSDMAKGMDEQQFKWVNIVAQKNASDLTKAEQIFGSKKDARQGKKSGSIIILIRKNGNTQIIFPGRSTTSYKPKGASEYKNNVWTSSVEFETLDLSSVKGDKLKRLKKVIPGAEITLKQSLEGEDSLLTFKFKDQDKVNVDISLKNSIYVAEHYLLYSWLTSKAARTRDRLNYNIFYFAERDSNQFSGDVALMYHGYVPLQERLESQQALSVDYGTIDDVSNIENMDVGGESLRRRYNPKKKRKSLRSKVKSSKKSKRRSLRRNPYDYR